MFAICADRQPRRLLRDITHAGAQEAADAIAIWAWGSLLLAAMRPAGSPNGDLDIALVRAHDGGWARPKDNYAADVLMRDATSFRGHCIARANPYCFQTCVGYCVRPP